MKRIVIMQPYYLAWYGFFEQIKLADIYVIYDDVQYVKGSLMNRVDIKTITGAKWLTIPLKKVHLGDRINEVFCKEEANWRVNHLNQLQLHYRSAPYLEEMLQLAESIFHTTDDRLIEVTATALKQIAAYFELDKKVQFYFSSDLDIPGKGTQRIFDISKSLGADTYLTGMGALKYMDFDLFEKGGIRVEFIDYAKTPYPQLHGGFNPYVSILDLIANTGKDGIRYMNSQTVHYKAFIHSETALEYLKK